VRDGTDKLSFGETLRLTSRYIEGNRRTLGIVVVAAVLSGFAEAIALVMIARLAFALATGHDQVVLTFGSTDISVGTGTLIGIAAALVVADIVMQVVGISARSRLGARVARKQRTRLVLTHLAAAWALQSEQRSGRLQEMVGPHVSEVSAAVTQLATGLVALSTLVAFLITALVVNLYAALGAAVVAAALAALLFPLRRVGRRASQQVIEANLVVSTDVAETTAHLQEIRVFGVDAEVGRRFADRIRTAAALEARRSFVNALAPVIYRGAALLLIVAAVGVLYSTSASNLGTTGGVVLIMLRSLTYAQSLQGSYQLVHSSMPTLEMLEQEVTRYEAAAVPRAGLPVERIGELAFDRVSFEYEPGVAVLRDLSFSVPHGSIIGIVGPSGAGKSTLVQLLLRFCEPSEGVVIADGRDVRTLAIDDWYARVSFVPQQPALFAGTVADNIRFYRETIDDGAVERAAKLADIHDEIMSWPLGYATPAGERGDHLSGGQRQRLCIARALAQEPDLIVFDESTSALDSRSEGIVRNVMASLAPRATVFVIAHRLSTLTICDRIMVLLDGELHGFDEPAQLERSSSFYREALRLSGLR
jgi:ABC-type multidrug transport system fused ATPase/permease subunit